MNTQFMINVANEKYCKWLQNGQYRNFSKTNDKNEINNRIQYLKNVLHSNTKFDGSDVNNMVSELKREYNNLLKIQNIFAKCLKHSNICEQKLARK